MNNIDQYLEKISSIQKSSPLGKIFTTSKNSYLFDTGTCKVVQCSSHESSILKCILEKGDLTDLSHKLKSELDSDTLENLLSDFIHTLQEEDLLNVTKKRTFHAPLLLEEYGKHRFSKLNQIILQVTERCNLRCRYCTYDDTFIFDRNHGTSDMDFYTAKNAVDYLNLHGREDQVYITFYGGEPLMNFELIKDVVDYSLKTLNRKIHFNLTTNLTLMTEEIADYLFSIENFEVLLSIDGPEEIHDSFRKTIDGKGSFHKAMRGLKYMVDAFGEDFKERVFINSVYTPPYSKEKVEMISKFFKDTTFFPLGTNTQLTYTVPESIPGEYYQEIGVEEDVDSSIIDWQYEKFLASFQRNTDIDRYLYNGILHHLKSIYNMATTEQSHFNIPFNNGCVPGKQRIFVEAGGDVKICEKIPGAEVMGNINENIDISRIKKKYIHDNMDYSKKSCMNCWANKNCTLCYAKAFKNGVLDVETRDISCDNIREIFEDNLTLYYSCYELDRERLENLFK